MRKCGTHKTYKAQRAPKSDCPCCWMIWAEKCDQRYVKLTDQICSIHDDLIEAMENIIRQNSEIIR